MNQRNEINFFSVEWIKETKQIKWIKWMKTDVWIAGQENVTESSSVDLQKDAGSAGSTSNYAAVVASHIPSGHLIEAEKLGIAVAAQIVQMNGHAILAQAKRETEQKNLVAANTKPV